MCLFVYLNMSYLKKHGRFPSILSSVRTSLYFKMEKHLQYPVNTQMRMAYSSRVTCYGSGKCNNIFCMILVLFQSARSLNSGFQYAHAQAEAGTEVN